MAADGQSAQWRSRQQTCGRAAGRSTSWLTNAVLAFAWCVKSSWASLPLIFPCKIPRLSFQTRLICERLLNRGTDVLVDFFCCCCEYTLVTFDVCEQLLALIGRNLKFGFCVIFQNHLQVTLIHNRVDEVFWGGVIYGTFTYPKNLWATSCPFACPHYSTSHGWWLLGILFRIKPVMKNQEGQYTFVF